MTLPVLTAHARTDALNKAMAARRERSDVLAALKNEQLSLRELLERTDSVIGKTPVKRLLESLPGVGKVRADKLLAELEISESRRVKGLGPRQRERLLERFPSQR
ncbi:integration host factor [Kitasatospora sp. NBC_00240]|uniref:integration host factor, actinobacterial type n=1 Tax=Kitasatospora sp. NBC_00240 TaxID=2903567 RepID=UPI00224CA5B7|nr:integration host factor, actinobacterial type [Kitasatospora sp. NBC_00240]MCX5215715.1 integration host factor [Kitasatospora sp. NBC_00240]